MRDQSSRREFLRRGMNLAAGAALLGEGLEGAEAAPAKKRVIVWSEGSAPKNVYPNDINAAIAEGLRPLKGWDVRTAALSEPEQGLPEALLNSASVLIWWGHVHHDEVQDALVQRIVHRVREGGMGFVATHSAHWSKPFKALMGTSGSWDGGYVEDGSSVLVRVAAPGHPIAKGLRDFVIPRTERYTEPFEVPTPDTLIFDGTYTRPDGTKEKSRQGMLWRAGKGHVFYFQPGHESYPIYFQPEVQKVFRNAVQWLYKAT